MVNCTVVLQAYVHFCEIFFVSDALYKKLGCGPLQTFQPNMIFESLLGKSILHRTLTPEPYDMKKFTTIIYGVLIKIACLSLASLLA
jgi:hypothetical protein